MQRISKSQRKSQLLEKLRMVEKDKQPLIITHRGKPVVQIVSYRDDPQRVLQELRGSVIAYSDPTKPAGEED